MTTPGTDVSSINIERVHEVGQSLKRIAETVGGLIPDAAKLHDACTTWYAAHTVDSNVSPIYRPTTEVWERAADKTVEQIQGMQTILERLGDGLVVISKEHLEKELTAANTTDNVDSNIGGQDGGGVPGGAAVPPSNPGLTTPAPSTTIPPGSVPA